MWLLDIDASNLHFSIFILSVIFFCQNDDSVLCMCSILNNVIS